MLYIGVLTSSIFGFNWYFIYWYFHMSIRTRSLVVRRSHCIPFSSKLWLNVTGKPEGVWIHWIIIPLRKTPPESKIEPSFSRQPNYMGHPQTKSLFSNKWKPYNLHSWSIVITRFHITLSFKKHGTRWLLKSTWLLMLVRLANMKILPYFGVSIFSVGIFCSYYNTPLVQTTTHLD